MQHPHPTTEDTGPITAHRAFGPALLWALVTALACVAAMCDGRSAAEIALLRTSPPGQAASQAAAMSMECEARLRSASRQNRGVCPEPAPLQ